jgi:hypothetical protein
MMTKLSPQAQAVLDAIQDELDATVELVPCTERIAAAVLRAAALHCKRDTLILLSIADELEGFAPKIFSGTTNEQ